VLGAEHPSTLTSMANLASTYSRQKRWTEAEGILLLAVDAHQRVLGPSHPDTEGVQLQLHDLRQARLEQTADSVTRQNEWSKVRGQETTETPVDHNEAEGHVGRASRWKRILHLRPKAMR
jgi:hypothetical protein